MALRADEHAECAGCRLVDTLVKILGECPKSPLDPILLLSFSPVFSPVPHFFPAIFSRSREFLSGSYSDFKKSISFKGKRTKDLNEIIAGIFYEKQNFLVLLFDCYANFLISTD